MREIRIENQHQSEAQDTNKPGLEVGKSRTNEYCLNCDDENENNNNDDGYDDYNKVKKKQRHATQEKPNTVCI